MAGITSYPPLGAIKSIQAGTISIAGANVTNTATVTAVDTTKAVLTFLGYSMDVANPECSVRIALTNSTTITATRSSTGGGTTTSIVGYFLTEYY